MTVKYEYVLYVPGIETPEYVAETDGTKTGDEVLAALRTLIRHGLAKNVEISRREIGALAWHDIPQAF